jgi:hypothetical protein
MRKIHHHSSAVIVSFRDSERFLFSMYDKTYPSPEQRGKLNILGGNFHPGDESPLETLTRELEEEFISGQRGEMDPLVRAFSGKGGGSSGRDISLYADKSKEIKNAILASIVPYQDFVIALPTIKREMADVLHSIFLANPSQQCQEVVEESIRKGHELRSEGHTGLASADEIKKGKVLMAYGAGAIMGYFLRRPVPHLPGIKLRAIGLPRDSYNSYSPDFRYTSEPMRHLNQADKMRS